ncbi:ATP-grasp domain-containing protein (plasmid) [Bartonella sp. HY329]|uniref:acetyl/propionyl/methylcrotonyl-CoA carboxylase subunit alpha n=1 Tax=unclassified Bartonella TaxID=2645622 RepID=UPI0021CA0D49|nr:MULTISPECIES: biotin carboxylase N-terminal domain-containing protein [unclassified Bartonella]UXM96615.1 ATP-grasp domain-containing protein [Bartonella sp. HY329]UXN10938.1 ATP-grasp domain-containing protein [Bartonella sp. HY328]
MKKVLIANRGEIAVRIIQAAKDYGLQSVAIYADSDCDALFVRYADEAYALGGDTPSDTYLNIEKIIAIAKKSGADAIHPGYGFLSERSEFARKIEEAGLIFIGPSPEVIDMLGDKVEARATAQKVGAPLVAGSDGAVNSPEEVAAFAKKYGFPLAIKAAHGGGGRGMKVVWQEADIVDSYHSAVREAVTAFGRGECYVEQFLDRPRHVEAQIIADKHGNVVVVGTRDCSMQRRNQKLIEEAPAPFLTDEQRQRIHVSAAAICKEAGYVGAGTVEFLLGQNGVISFLEVNTRLQVEHPVTEETTNIDLVVEQFRIAEGLRLSIDETPQPIGHAIEFRINAEDVARGFLPAPGEITLFSAPFGAGIRIDSGVASGSQVAPMFDSMMAKLIVRGKNREDALHRAKRALSEFAIEGVASVLPFHRLVVEHSDFTAENGFKVHTRWIETDFSAELEMGMRAIPEPVTMKRSFIEIDGKRVSLGLPEAFLKSLGAFSLGSQAANDSIENSNEPNAVKATVPGSIRAWLVEDQTKVQEGDAIAVMEAMKMETTIFAPISGTLSITALAGTVQKLGNIIGRIEA